MLVAWEGVDYWGYILFISCLGLLLNSGLLIFGKKNHCFVLPASLAWTSSDLAISLVTICSALTPHLNSLWAPLQESLFLDVEVLIIIYSFLTYCSENVGCIIQASKWIPVKQLCVHCFVKVSRESNTVTKDKMILSIHILLTGIFLISICANLYLFKKMKRNSKHQKILGLFTVVLLQQFTKFSGLIQNSHLGLNSSLSFMTNLSNIIVRPLIILFYRKIHQKKVFEPLELQDLPSSSTTGLSASQTTQLAFQDLPSTSLFSSSSPSSPSTGFTASHTTTAV